MIKTQDNFDWIVTDKPLVMYIPNYGRKNLLQITLERFKTNCSTDQYVILVVNDGLHEDLSDLQDKYGIEWFTFTRRPNTPRNCCMIRNYIIKNIKNQLDSVVMTKDPEIFFNNNIDIIEKALESKNNIWRPSVLHELHAVNTQQLSFDPHIDIDKLKIDITWQASQEKHDGFHNGVCIPIAVLNKMGGYDEDFKNNFGWEDVDLFYRLKKMKVKIKIDKEVSGYHIYHFQDNAFIQTGFNNNKDIFLNKNPENFVRNQNGWGNGN